MTYDYGPDVDFRIRIAGDLGKPHGSCRAGSQVNQYLAQNICHMVYQLKWEIQASPDGVLKFDWGYIHWLHRPNGMEDYSAYCDGMLAFHIIETGYHSFDLAFLSSTQLAKLEALPQYASEHRKRKGRTL